MADYKKGENLPEKKQAKGKPGKESCYMLCCCVKCKFVFESIRMLETCPDCGSGPVRTANEAEAAEYAVNRRIYGPMQIYGTKGLFPVKDIAIPWIVRMENGKPVFEKCLVSLPVTR